jgi:hypothetical protein
MSGGKKDKGVVVHTLEKLFQELGKERGCFCKLTMSYFEIYNEKIFDLLKEEEIPLKIRKNQNDEVVIKGLSEEEVMTPKAAVALYKKGEKKRAFASTDMNFRSSRSHVILKLKIETRYNCQPHKKYFSTLMMADLAGSECIQNSKTTGANQREGSLINKSLLSLSKVIKKLSKNQGDFISYRDSNLTRVFEPVFSGNSRTLVICTINPLKKHLQESLNTLRFGITVGGIKIDTQPQNSVVNMQSIENLEEINKMSINYEEVKLKNEELKLNLTLKEADLEMKDQIINDLKMRVEFLEGSLDSQEKLIEDLKSDNKDLLNLIETVDQNKVEKQVDEKMKAIQKVMDMRFTELEDKENKIKLIEEGKFEKILREKLAENEKSVLGLVNEILRRDVCKVKKLKKRFRMAEEQIPEVKKKVEDTPLTKRREFTFGLKSMSKHEIQREISNKKNIEIAKLKDKIVSLNDEVRELKFELQVEKGQFQKRTKKVLGNLDRNIVQKEKKGGVGKMTEEQNRPRKLLKIKGKKYCKENMPKLLKELEKKVDTGPKRKKLMMTPSKVDLRKEIRNLKKRMTQKEKIILGYEKQIRIYQNKQQRIAKQNNKLIEMMQNTEKIEKREAKQSPGTVVQSMFSSLKKPNVFNKDEYDLDDELDRQFSKLDNFSMILPFSDRKELSNPN